MITIDLITGFLGSGKTTFIMKYAEYLMQQGKRIGILENDYGAVNVDMMLLQDLESENCGLEMVAGGYDADCHKRRFKTKLITMAMFGYDRIIVEPSGIYDLDEFFDTLREEPLDELYTIGSVISIVDASTSLENSDNSKYLLASEIANAGVILFSKTQGLDDSQIQKTLQYCNSSLEHINSKRRFYFDGVVTKEWDKLTSSDFEAIAKAGYTLAGYVKQPISGSYSTLFYLDVQVSEDELRKKVYQTFQDARCGKIHRIKGFMKNGEDEWLELNATQQENTIKPIEKGQEIIIIIGENLDEKAIGEYWKNI